MKSVTNFAGTTFYFMLICIPQYSMYAIQCSECLLAIDLLQTCFSSLRHASYNHYFTYFYDGTYLQYAIDPDWWSSSIHHTIHLKHKSCIKPFTFMYKTLHIHIGSVWDIDMTVRLSRTAMTWCSPSGGRSIHSLRMSSVRNHHRNLLIYYSIVL